MFTLRGLGGGPTLAPTIHGGAVIDGGRASTDGGHEGRNVVEQGRRIAHEGRGPIVHLRGPVIHLGRPIVYVRGPVVHMGRPIGLGRPLHHVLERRSPHVAPIGPARRGCCRI